MFLKDWIFRIPSDAHNFDNDPFGHAGKHLLYLMKEKYLLKLDVYITDLMYLKYPFFELIEYTCSFVLITMVLKYVSLFMYTKRSTWIFEYHF